MIRPIRPWEMPEVEALAKEFHDLAKTDTTFSPARFWQTINALDQAGVLFLHGMFVDDVLAGVLIGTVSRAQKQPVQRPFAARFRGLVEKTWCQRHYHGIIRRNRRREAG